MREQFEQIYAVNAWGYGSGEGSLPMHATGYVRYLQRLLREKQIRSVVDLGCGDWQFSQLVDWSGIHYRGYDVVRPVIERNRATHARSNVEFHDFSGNFAELPGADLLIAKDVLQHWSNESVAEFLPTLDRYRYALVTNCVNPRGVTLNEATTDGGFHYLDLRLPPFSIAAEHVLTITNYRPWWQRPFVRPRWRKQALLIDNRRDAAQRRRAA